MCQWGWNGKKKKKLGEQREMKPERYPGASTRKLLYATKRTLSFTPLSEMEKYS